MDHIESVRARSALVVDAVRAVGIDAPVPSCPGWDLHELVLHTGTTHRWAATIVATRAEGYVPPDLGDVPTARGAIVDWFADGVERFTAILGAAGPDLAVWTWDGSGRAGFWSRRMDHETAVHSWDAGAAAGDPAPIAPAAAVDGIDEQLANLPHMVAFRPEVADLTGAGETIHLHATDTEGEWVIRLDPDGVHWSHAHEKGDVAARGPASDLFLFLVGRVAPDALEVFGDASLLSRWQERFRF